VCSVDVGSIGRTTYKLLSCDCVRVASQDPEEELAASNFLTQAPLVPFSTLCSTIVQVMVIVSVSAPPAIIFYKVQLF
jgi:hypothetical protein